jgi:hypothetical protein
MEEAPENSKESPNSAYANGMNEMNSLKIELHIKHGLY